MGTKFPDNRFDDFLYDFSFNEKFVSVGLKQYSKFRYAGHGEMLLEISIFFGSIRGKLSN